MTVIEARKELERFVTLKTSQRPVFLDVVLEVLDRQIPKKPKWERAYENDDIGFIEAVCPICNHSVLECTNFCSCCGQAIDWSEEE